MPKEKKPKEKKPKEKKPKEKKSEEKKSEEKKSEEKKSERSFLKLIILVVLVIVLGVGGYLGWDMFIKGGKKEGKNEAQISETQPQENKEEAPITYPLDTFIVNLMDKSGSGKRYLKAGIILEIGNQEQGMMMEKYKPQLRDTILILLSSKSFKEISTMEGKLELKQELLLRVNQILSEAVVRRIYFTEFVVQ